MERLDMDNKNSGAIAPQGGSARPFGRVDLITAVYNQYENWTMKDLWNNSEDLSGLKSV